MAETSDRTRAVILRLADAANRHDLAELVECFAPDYLSEQPNHPERTFRGREQVRKNWGTLFESMPDLQMELRATSVDGDTGWTEWHWTGKQSDGGAFDWRGVIILGVRQDHIAWMRLYMEPMDMTAQGIDATVQAMIRRSNQPPS
ncbi:MAG TPA: nuclear transport factor 2 family protein [Chloroflexota bacterium]|jgi:ketosteroid isomerase-like protein